MERLRIPVVNYCDEVKTRLTTVMYDQVKIGRMAAAHLIEQGLTQFAYASLAHGYCATLRWQGFAAPVKEAGFSCRLMDDDFSAAEQLNNPNAVITEWLKAPAQAGGILVAYTALALRSSRPARELASRSLAMSRYSADRMPAPDTNWRPTISAFELPQERLAYESMKALDALVHGAPAPATPILLAPGPVIQRESTISAPTATRWWPTPCRSFASTPTVRFQSRSCSSMSPVATHAGGPVSHGHGLFAA